MKKISIVTLGIFISLFFISCQNDGWKEEIDKLKNELDIQRQLIEKLSEGITIKNILSSEGGYEITFSNGSTLFANQGTSLVVSVGSNGYWFINNRDTGYACESEEGEIPTINVGGNGNWFIDNHDTGINAGDGNSDFSKLITIIFDGEKAYFTFSDGTRIEIPVETRHQDDAFINDICIPYRLYMLSDTQNDIFAEAITKRWRPYHEIVRFQGTSAYSRQLERVSSIDAPKNNRSVTTNLLNYENFQSIKTITSIIRVGEKFKGTDEVTVQILGDSYVNGAFFRDALLTKGYVPNIKLIGLRKISKENGQYDEGRSGWTLDMYFKVHLDAVTSYHGYMHPEGECCFMGTTGFWINCHKFISKELPDLYNCDRYDEIAEKFDKETGYLLSPRKNDLLFDNSIGKFVRYDGEKWEQKERSEFLSWSFNYKKYLSAWNLPAPEFFAEMLGLNDFRNNINADFTEFNDQIRIMKESYFEAVPNGKFIIMIPNSTLGNMDNTHGDFTLIQNAAMWRFRKNLIDTFDRREEEGYHLLDIGITIDSQNGYNFNEEGLQTGNPHPYPNYPSMGIPLAAFIQYHR